MTNISFLNLKVVKESTARYDIERKINRPEDIVKVAIEVIQMQDRAEESLWMVTLDTKNNITGIFEVSRGSLASSVVHPREVYKRAILQNASSIVLMHNHPSGNSTPSQEDINITKRLFEVGKLVGIDLIDHIVIGAEDDWSSLKAKGVI